MSDTHHQPTDEARRGVASVTEATPAPHPFVAFDDILRYLRGLPGPCIPPIGAGDFDVLYASPREVVVWYAPARDREGQTAREVAIPCAPLDAAWGALRDGRAVAEATLCQLAGGAAGGRWLLVILAQLPLAQVRADADGAYTLAWAPTHAADTTAAPDALSESIMALTAQHAEADAL